MSHLDSKILHELRTRFGVPPAVQTPETQCEQLQQLCQALLAELNSLKDESARQRQEIKDLRRAVFHYLEREINPEDGNFSVEEVQAIARNCPSFKELIEESFRD